ncbi:hypothetical protein JXA56_03420 [Candidatus Micrarchaeota archaeon]|nr:hypothetical protein [Candidatus Micrarchaeota archaeon]
MEIKSSKPVSLTEAKEILEERIKEGELGYEQAQALEHATKFSRESMEKIKKKVETLAKRENISDGLAIKIVDANPVNPATIKAILAKDKIEISDEEASDILKEVS